MIADLPSFPTNRHEKQEHYRVLFPLELKAKARYGPEQANGFVLQGATMKFHRQSVVLAIAADRLRNRGTPETSPCLAMTCSLGWQYMYRYTPCFQKVPVNPWTTHR